MRFDPTTLRNLTEYIRIALVAGCIVFIIALMLTAITANHSPRGYYLEARPSVVCAVAHSEWWPDAAAYCSDDKDKVLDFVLRANAALK